MKFNYNCSIDEVIKVCLNNQINVWNPIIYVNGEEPEVDKKLKNRLYSDPFERKMEPTEWDYYLHRNVDDCLREGNICLSKEKLNDPRYFMPGLIISPWDHDILDIINENFGEFLNVIEETKYQHFFLFTIHPINFTIEDVKTIFKNVTVGTPIQSKEDLEKLKVLKECNAGHKFIFIEYVNEDLGDVDLEYIDWVIIDKDQVADKSYNQKKYLENIIKQCKVQNVAVYVRGGNKLKEDGMEYHEFPKYLMEQDHLRNLVEQIL